jgi:hypothetical protein
MVLDRYERKKKRCGDTAMSSKKESLKAFGDLKVSNTEENKLKLDQEELAKLGINNLHRNITMVLTRNQDLDKKVTYAEIQMVVTQSGVIPLIQKRDGSTVIQSFLVIFLQVQVKKTFQERIKEEDTEVLRERQRKENNA